MKTDPTREDLLQKIADLENRLKTFVDFESVLKVNEDKLRSLFENDPRLIIAFDRQGVILDCNSSMKHFLGYEPDDLVGTCLGLLVSAEQKLKFETCLKDIFSKGACHQTEFQMVRKDRHPVDVAVSSSVLKNGAPENAAAVCIIEDITEKKKMEKDLRQAHKMESVGALAGGIANDFNNILSAIIGYAELTFTDAGNSGFVSSNLERILSAAMRAKELVGQILTFSRQDEQKLMPILVHPVINDALKMVRSSLPSTVEIKSDISRCGTVMGDATRIHQVLLNLCTNAWHAMGGGGVLTVSLKETDIDKNEAGQFPGHFPRKFVRLDVRDTGAGIDSDIIDRVFEPFFTTKGVGEGTGMGLAVVHGIVTQLDGRISVESTPGEGSCFRVYLPVISGEDQVAKHTERPVPTGSESVLFVDDETVLVGLGKMMLGRLGYTVETRTDSREALELFRTCPERFDLLITDLTMPHMTGENLARKIREIRPDLPVILCTGFSELATENKIREAGIDIVLKKPVIIADMAEAIRTVLDRKS